MHTQECYDIWLEREVVHNNTPLWLPHSRNRSKIVYQIIWQCSLVPRLPHVSMKRGSLVFLVVRVLSLRTGVGLESLKLECWMKCMCMKWLTIFWTALEVEKPCLAVDSQLSQKTLQPSWTLTAVQLHRQVQEGLTILSGRFTDSKGVYICLMWDKTPFNLSGTP